MDRQPKIDKLFSDKLRNYEVAPPPKAWSAIKAGLARKVPFYQTTSFLFTAALTALFIGSGLGYFNYDRLPYIGKTATPTLITTPDNVVHSTFAPNTQTTDNPTNNDNLLRKATHNPNLAQPATIDAGKEKRANNMPNVEQDMPLSQQHNNEKVFEAASAQQIILLHETTAITAKTAHSNQEKDITLHTQISKLPIDPTTALFKTTQPPLNHLTAPITQPQLPAQHEAAKSSLPDMANKHLTTHPTTPETNTSQLELPIAAIKSRASSVETETAIDISESVLQQRETMLNPQWSATPQKPQRSGTGLYLQAFAMYGGSRIWSSNIESNTLRTPFGSTYSYGIGLGYDITPRFGVVAEYIAQMRQTQTVERDQNGTVTESPIRLSYVAIPVLAKIRLLGSTNLKHASELNVLVGLQYAQLKSAAINSDNAYFLNLLKKDNWGFAAGIEYDHYLSQHVVATAGLRTYLQMPANSLFDLQLPATNSTNNLFIGGKVGLNYRF